MRRKADKLYKEFEAKTKAKGKDKVMKINNTAGNDSIVKNGYIQNRMDGGAKSGEAVKVENGTINASGLGIFQDDIANKKQKAMQNAMQFVKEQFKADSKVDDTLDACRARSKESRESLKEAQKELNALEEEKNKIKEEYGEDSEDYKIAAEEYDKMAEPWLTQKAAAQKDIAMQSGMLRGMKLEMLKNHAIIDAENAKDLTLEAAGKEVIGMLMDEAKEKIDKDIEDAVDKGKDQKEEAEKTKEELEKVQAEQKKKAQDAEEESKESHVNSKKNSASAVDAIQDINEKYKKVVENTEKIAAEQKVLMDELKGGSVDVTL